MKKEIKPARIHLARLSGQKGVPYRYMTRTQLLRYRDTVRAAIETTRGLVHEAVDNENLRTYRVRQMYKLVGECAAISRTLRDRWQDPEDLNWKLYRGKS